MFDLNAIFIVAVGGEPGDIICLSLGVDVILESCEVCCALLLEAIHVVQVVPKEVSLCVFREGRP